MFTQTYKDSQTEELKTDHTNTIQGSWKHAKEHFQRINGTSVKNFDGHLCEVIWRNRVASKHQDIIVEFFNLVRECYSLDKERNLLIRQPLFNTQRSSSSRKLPIDRRAARTSTSTADADPPLPAGESHHSNTAEHPHPPSRYCINIENLTQAT